MEGGSKNNAALPWKHKMNKVHFQNVNIGKINQEYYSNNIYLYYYFILCQQSIVSILFYICTENIELFDQYKAESSINLGENIFNSFEIYNYLNI